VGGDCTPVSGENMFCVDSWCPPLVAPATSVTCQPPQPPGAACSWGTFGQWCEDGYQCVGVDFGSSIGVCGRVYCGRKT
jgi:hypothetical protein